MAQSKYPTIQFDNESITIISPDGETVIINEEEVRIKFKPTGSNDSLSCVFTPEKCDIEKRSDSEDERMSSNFYYPKVALDEETRFHFKQNEVDIRVNNKGKFHGAVTVGTNTESRSRLSSKIRKSDPNKILTFKDMKTIELSESLSEEKSSSDEVEEIIKYDFLLNRLEPIEPNVEKRIFLIPPCFIDSPYKYGFELFEKANIKQKYRKNFEDTIKIGSDYVHMTKIPLTKDFGTNDKCLNQVLGPRIKCKPLNIVEKMKQDWKGSFWKFKYYDICIFNINNLTKNLYF